MKISEKNITVYRFNNRNYLNLYSACYAKAKLQLQEEAVRLYSEEYSKESTKKEEYTGRTLYLHCFDNYNGPNEKWLPYPQIEGYELEVRRLAAEFKRLYENQSEAA